MLGNNGSEIYELASWLPQQDDFRRQGTSLMGIFKLVYLDLRISPSRQYNHQAVNARTTAKKLSFTPT